MNQRMIKADDSFLFIVSNSRNQKIETGIVVIFNAVQNASFFTNGPQMALSPQVRERLAQEGLENANNLVDFKKEQLEQAYKNMRTAIQGVPEIAAQLDNDGNVLVEAIPAVMPSPPVLVPAKCCLRLLVASVAYHYYESIVRDQTPQNMNCSLILKGFYSEYEAIVELAEEDKPDVPALHKNSTPLKWIKSFKDLFQLNSNNPITATFGNQGDISNVCLFD